MTRRPANEHQSTQYRTVDDTECEVTIDYTITPYDPGRTSGPPEDCYPPEGGEVEIVRVTDEAGNEIEPTDAEHAEWSDRIYEDHDFDGDDGRPDRSERDYDDI